MQKIKKLQFIFFLVYAQFVWAQHYHFKNYTIEDGLPQSQINALYQDSKGYIWIGTNGGGVSKFDGKKFVNYSKSDGLSDNIINCIYEDWQGNIWLGTNTGGVNIFDSKKFISYTVNEGLSSNKISAIFQKQDGTLLFGTDSGLNVFRDQKIQETRFSHQRIRSIFNDKKGNIWVATDEGVTPYEKNELQYDIRKKYQFTLSTAFSDHDGNIWIGVYFGDFIKINGKNVNKFDEKVGLRDKIIYSLMEDNERNIWIGTDTSGVCKYDGKTFKHYTEKDGLPDNRVKAMIQDREGNLWFGTEKGLCKFDGGVFSAYSAKEGLSNDVVNAILKDHTGAMWFGTATGLSKKNGPRIDNFTLKDGLSHNKILSLSEDNRGNLWIGTYDGLCKLTINSGSIKPHIISLTKGNHNIDLNNNIIYALYPDDNGNLYVGTDGGFLVFKDDKCIARYKCISDSNAYRVRCILKDKQGFLWMGLREQGVSKFDGQNFINYSKKNGLPDNNVTSLAQDQFGDIWMTTYGGGLIRCFKENNKEIFHAYTVKEGLSNDATLSITIDAQNNLWIGTINGLNCLDLNKFHKNGSADFEYYGKEKGFTGGECNQNAVFNDNNGDVWFGTLNGAIKFTAGKVKRNVVPPFIYIDNVRLFFKNIHDSIHSIADLPQGTSFSYNKNHLTFDYHAVSFTSNTDINYQYKLEGLDNDWSPLSKETFATYSSIPPGNYTFMVKARNGDAVWSEKPAKFSFEIKPPFWKTWWFYILSSLAIATIFLYFMQLFINKINQKKAEKEERLNKEIEQQKIITAAMIEAQEQERKRIAEELHDGLGQVFTAIKLNINRLEPLVKQADENKKKHFNTSVSLLDQAIDELREISHNMMPSHLTDLGLITALRALCEKMNQTGLLDCQFISTGSDQRYDSVIEVSLYRIAQELINNTVKHSKATKINVQLIKHLASVMLQVEDNGKGFDIPNAKKSKMGIGIENIKSRVEQLNGILTIDSNRNSGTSVVIEIPV